MYGTHAITDETSDTLYALFENGATEGGPHLLNVTRVEFADSGWHPQVRPGYG